MTKNVGELLRAKPPGNKKALAASKGFFVGYKTKLSAIS